MTQNETIIADALSVVNHVYDNLPLKFSGQNFRLENGENTVSGDFKVHIKEERCFVLTNPDIGNIEVGIILKRF